MSFIGVQTNNNQGDVNNVQGVMNNYARGASPVANKRARRSNSNTRELDQIIAAFGKSLSAYKFFTTVDRRKPVHDTLLIDSTGEGAFLDLLCKTPQDTAVARAKGSDA